MRETLVVRTVECPSGPDTSTSEVPKCQVELVHPDLLLVRVMEYCEGHQGSKFHDKASLKGYLDMTKIVREQRLWLHSGC